MTARLEVLSREDCIRLLRGVPVGRLVYTQRALPAIVPVNFVLDGNELLIRAGYGGALAAAARGSVVAFEADAFDTDVHEAWSVTVTGRAREETDEVEVARLMQLGLRPWAPGERDHFLKIPLDIVTGRRLTDAESHADVAPMTTAALTA